MTAEIWQRYIQALKDRGFHERRARWYVIRAERFLQAFPDQDPSGRTADDLDSYLRALGRDGRLEDWQFRQAVESLEIMFGQVLRSPWASKFDWHFWKDSAQRLERSHVSLARQDEAEGQRLASAPSPDFLTDRDAVLSAVVREIRRRSYSYRTEQAYVHWIGRFLRSFPEERADQLGGTEVKRFLEGLAVERNVASSTQNQALFGIHSQRICSKAATIFEPFKRSSATRMSRRP